MNPETPTYFRALLVATVVVLALLGESFASAAIPVCHAGGRCF